MTHTRFTSLIGGVALISSVLSASCGSSSSTSVTSPTSSRCAATLAASLPTADAAGGSGTLSITINRECSWTVKTDADWLGIASSSTSGQGNGSVPYTVAPNAVVTTRRANLMVNDQALAVQQAAAACVFVVDRSQKSFDAAGGTQSVGVTAQAGCAWTAQSQAPWLDIAGGKSGNGSGTVTMVASGNSQVGERERDGDDGGEWQ